MTEGFNGVLSVGAQGTFFVLLFVFTLHALFLGYHWLNYGTSKKVAETAILVYVAGGVALLAILGGIVFFKM